MTIPNGSKPAGALLPSPLYHGNGTLWTMLYPDGKTRMSLGNLRPDASLAISWPWWQAASGPLQIEGRRLDAPAPPLRTEMQQGAAGASPQFGTVIFPTAGCWEITARAGDSPLTFVTLVITVQDWSSGGPTPTGTLATGPGGARLSVTPTATPIPYAGWQTYADKTYGFSFRYPPGWTIQEDLNSKSTTYRHLLRLRPPNQPEAVLSIGFKRPNEKFAIQRTGVGAGNQVKWGEVSFLGEKIPRVVLVNRGKDMAVLYNRAAETRRGNLVFTLALDYTGKPTDARTLGEDLQSVVDRIVESFTVSK